MYTDIEIKHRKKTYRLFYRCIGMGLIFPWLYYLIAQPPGNYLDSSNLNFYPFETQEEKIKKLKPSIFEKS